MRLSTLAGLLLMWQFVVASYFAIRQDWTWFAIATLGWFSIVVFGMEER